MFHTHRVPTNTPTHTHTHLLVRVHYTNSCKDMHTLDSTTEHYAFSKLLESVFPPSRGSSTRLLTKSWLHSETDCQLGYGEDGDSTDRFSLQ